MSIETISLEHDNLFICRRICLSQFSYTQSLLYLTSIQNHTPHFDVSVTATANLQTAIEELRRELNELRATSVSRTVFNDLRADNEQLKKDLESVKSTYGRRIRDIMNELDEEKKIRLATQVEMERIRKIVAESHV